METGDVQLPEQHVPEPSDPLLADYLSALDPLAADRALRVLIETEAAPVIRSVLTRKGEYCGTGEAADVESAVREQLIRQLYALRAGERENPIARFRSYVAGVTFSAWAEHLRSRHPRRSMLLNRLRYLLENRTAMRGFALWEDAARNKWCGLADWRQRGPDGSSTRLQLLLGNPVAAAREALGATAARGEAFALLVAKLLKWLATPIELRDLVAALAEIQSLGETTDESTDDASGETAAAWQNSPAEELEWKEYLQWLWDEIGALSPRQTAAFLLNSDVLRDLEVLGIASIRLLAPRLEMSPEHLAAVWQKLPLDDLAIAAELHCTRQQVINLRRVARDNLGRAWRLFSGSSAVGGNKIERFPSSSA